MIAKLSRVRLVRDQRGFTVAELAVTSALAALALSFVAVFLVGAMRTGIFTEGQAFTINDARNAMQRIEKEVRGSDNITWCEPVGSCLEVGAQTAVGGFRTVRYARNGADLQRQEYDTVTASWGPPETIIERVANSGLQPVFACDTVSSFLRVNVDLHIEPTPQSSPKYNVQTSIRPRNFRSTAVCP